MRNPIIDPTNLDLYNKILDLHEKLSNMAIIQAAIEIRQVSVVEKVDKLIVNQEKHEEKDDKRFEHLDHERIRRRDLSLPRIFSFVGIGIAIYRKLKGQI